MFTHASLFRTLLLLGLCFAGHAQAVSIEYRASDLPDAVGQADRWRYAYRVSGNFAAFTGFNVFFDPTLYGALEDPPPAPNAQWTALTVQPDDALPAAGFYTAIAQQDGASLADDFTVDFVWRGTGTPAGQPYEVFDDSFNVVGIGQTSPFGAPAIPEPGSLLLLAGALGLLACRRG